MNDKKGKATKSAVPVLEQLERMVIGTDSVDVLYSCEMEIRRLTNKCHADLKELRNGGGDKFNRQDTVEYQEGAIKADMNILEGLLGICGNRKDMLSKESMAFNWRFRENTKKMIDRMKYEEIYSASKTS